MKRENRDLRELVHRKGTQVEWELDQIIHAYELGVISKEEQDKLLDDITPQLWKHLGDILCHMK